MTETPAAEETAQTPKPLTAAWRERTFELKPPSGAQLMMWNRVARQFGEMSESDKIDNDEFRKVLNRLGDVVFGVFASPVDVEWLEDEILAERIVDEDLLDLFATLRDSLVEQGQGEGGAEPNRAQRRAAQRVK